MKCAQKTLNVFIIFCIIFSSENIHAQLGFCQGNSGDPIFTENFGIGTTNTSLPAGTTTYTFANIDPQDGYYTVSSNTGYFDWHNTQDHTPGDTNGRSLIVNADFTIGEFYRTTINGLCEETSYEFSAWLLNLLPPSGCGGSGIPINVKFQIWDISDTNLLASGDTGNISGSSSPDWQQYGLVFQTLPSQTAIILKMINNSIGGCGNDLAIDDLVFKTCGDFISVGDTSGNNNISICSSQAPYTLDLIATPDNTVFSSHFYQWQQSTDASTWTDIVGSTNQSISVSGIINTMYYRAKVAESALNLTNSDCITFSDIFQITVNQAPAPPSIDCWQTAIFNVASCSWDITGTQDPIPTGLDCWETATFNTTTCSWDVTGTQDPIPTGLNCWQTAIFNVASCSWDITGTQDPIPTGLDCWETATFSSTSCSWQVTGTQDPIPTGLDCWETATFNSTSCSWEVAGTQDPIPTGLDCWETATFNSTNCAWEVTGTQDPIPTGLECWETATFNSTSCAWEVTGTQDLIPTGLECWQTTSFNTETCVWDIHGEEPIDSIEEFEVICEGQTVTLHANSSDLNPEYLWNTGDITEEITVNSPGTYTVEITDNFCFTTIKTINVSLSESPQIGSVFSDGNNIIIEAVNTGDFEYSIDGIQFQTSNIFINAEGGLYSVYIRELNGCGIISFEHLHFKIPKFFTPNNDGIHDTFDLKGIEYYSSSEVYIFNSYGKLLKTSINLPFAWNGKFNNKNLPNSDYWYIIKIDNHEFRGHFTLKR